MPIDETAARVALQNMAQAVNEETRWHLALAGMFRDGDTQFIRDETIPRDEVYLMSTPFDPNSVTSRILDHSDGRPWGGLAGEAAQLTPADFDRAGELLRRDDYRVWQGLANGEPLTPGTCQRCGAVGPTVPRRCGARECHSQVCIDLCVECVGANSYNRPPRGVQHDWQLSDWGDAPDAAGYSVAATRTREQPRRLDYISLPDRGRPDHYRVRPGECSCGFRSAFVRDMDMHLSGIATDTDDGTAKYWRVCECGESRLCRRVAVPHFQLPNWTTTEFDRLPATPRFEEIYLCDACCERRGIS